MVFIPALTFSSSSAFRLSAKASVTAGSRLIAIASTNTIGIFTSGSQNPLIKPYKVFDIARDQPVACSLFITIDRSITIISGIIVEPIVIGIAILNISLIMLLLLSCLVIDSPMSFCLFFLFLAKRNTRTRVASMRPAEAPKVAPAAAYSRDFFARIKESVRPTPTLTSCSTTSEIAVGSMFWRPW